MTLLLAGKLLAVATGFGPCSVTSRFHSSARVGSSVLHHRRSLQSSQTPWLKTLLQIHAVPAENELWAPTNPVPFALPAQSPPGCVQPSCRLSGAAAALPARRRLLLRHLLPCSPARLGLGEVAVSVLAAAAERRGRAGRRQAAGVFAGCRRCCWPGKAPLAPFAVGTARGKAGGAGGGDGAAPGGGSTSAGTC